MVFDYSITQELIDSVASIRVGKKKEVSISIRPRHVSELTCHEDLQFKEPGSYYYDALCSFSELTTST